MVKIRLELNDTRKCFHFWHIAYDINNLWQKVLQYFLLDNKKLQGIRLSLRINVKLFSKFCFQKPTRAGFYK
jgi:hypothetical protein